MDQLNPYEASTDSSVPQIVDKDLARETVNFRGGVWAVVGVGVVGGLALIGLTAGLAAMENVPLLFAAPLVTFSAALGVTSLLLRGSTTTVPMRFGLAGLLSIPATLLFLPVCTASGFIGVIAIESSAMGNSYLSGTMFGLVIVFSFGVVLLLFAMLIRGQMRQRFRRQTPIDIRNDNPLLSGSIAPAAPLVEPFNGPRSD